MALLNRRSAILLARALGRLWRWEEWWVQAGIKGILDIMFWGCAVCLCNRYSADSVVDTTRRELWLLRSINWQLYMAMTR